jgi:hypothetical protein
MERQKAELQISTQFITLDFVLGRSLVVKWTAELECQSTDIYKDPFVLIRDHFFVMFRQ